MHAGAVPRNCGPVASGLIECVSEDAVVSLVVLAAAGVAIIPAAIMLDVIPIKMRFAVCIVVAFTLLGNNGGRS